MKLLKDFEKKFAIHIGIGFLWILSFVGVAYINSLIELPKIVGNILGTIALIGYVAIMVHGIWILICGFYNELKEQWKE